jgi:hypothetical protein
MTLRYVAISHLWLLNFLLILHSFTLIVRTIVWYIPRPTLYTPYPCVVYTLVMRPPTLWGHYDFLRNDNQQIMSACLIFSLKKKTVLKNVKPLNIEWLEM